MIVWWNLFWQHVKCASDYYWLPEGIKEVLLTVLVAKMKTCALHLIGFITVTRQFWDAGYVNKISCHVEIDWSCCCNFLFRLKWHECTNLRSEGFQWKNEGNIHFSDVCKHSHIRLRPSLNQLPQSCLLLQIKHDQIQSTAHGGKNKKEELL